MTYLLGAGSIRIDVTVSRALACSVEVKADRPQGLARMFVGRRPEEAPVLAGQVFSLCGFSQSVAARLAVLNAANLPMPAEERYSAAAGLLAERIFETLRALILHWPSPPPADQMAIAGRCLREVLATSQAIIAAARARKMDHMSLAGHVDRLAAAATSLGIAGEDGLPPPETVFSAIFRDVVDDRTFAGHRPDPLTVADDGEVVAHLCRDVDYSALPHLAGRVAETGAYARLYGTGRSGQPHLAQRLLARLGDVRNCLEQLSGFAQQNHDDIAGLMAGGSTPDTGGFGAVECARGRLYHQAEIGPDGLVSAYRILAPTEWNFHPAGPFVETLLSSRIGAGESAARSVSRLAVLFDPCVAFEVGIHEAAHA